MDVFLIIVLFIVFCVLFSVCGWCCKKHREGTVYGVATPSVLQVSVPPYPVDNSRQPHVQPAPGFAPGAYPPMPYPATTSYPSQPAGGYPPAHMPTYPAAGTGYLPPQPPYPVATNMAPYPPAGGAAYPTSGAVQQSPPSYMETVGQPATDAYSKQAPYNPNY